MQSDASCITLLRRLRSLLGGTGRTGGLLRAVAVVAGLGAAAVLGRDAGLSAEGVLDGVTAGDGGLAGGGVVDVALALLAFGQHGEGAFQRRTFGKVMKVATMRAPSAMGRSVPVSMTCTRMPCSRW